mmetsp:Transcript_3714/g.5084  ORF Transcript_3714/g.5084 Transcript_3714/m.5084 type:complete len:278 (-) Transcript_3714:2-835(-)
MDDIILNQSLKVLLKGKRDSSDAKIVREISSTSKHRIKEFNRFNDIGLLTMKSESFESIIIEANETSNSNPLTPLNSFPDRKKSSNSSLKGLEETKNTGIRGSQSTTPLLVFLQQLGGSQREALQKVYDTTIDIPCQSFSKCDNYMGDIKCNIPFLHESGSLSRLREQKGYDPFDRDIVGPKSCEFCDAPSLTLCKSTCERPKTFLQKKRPPFESMDQWDPVTEYKLENVQYVSNQPTGVKINNRKKSPGDRGFGSGKTSGNSSSSENPSNFLKFFP